MTVPKSRVLSVSKGILALADLKHNSPDVSQNVIVNVGQGRDPVGSGNKEDVKPRNAVVNGEVLPDVVIVPPAREYKENQDQPQLDVKYDPNVDNPYVTTSIGDLQTMIIEKDNIAKALSIMLELVENNPLIVNKLIIAPANTLAELIKLLASADEVKISYILDSDVGCSCGSVKYVPVDKIYVIKHGLTQVLKYAYPDVIQILDQHKISYKLVTNDS